jgi:hypothetical protein
MNQQTEQNWLPQYAQEACLKNFERIFRLGASGQRTETARVVSVEKHGGTFRVTFKLGDAPPLTIWILPFSESPCYFQTKQLNINHEGEHLSSHAKDFLEEFQKNLKNVRIEDMERVLSLMKNEGRKPSPIRTEWKLPE